MRTPHDMATNTSVSDSEHTRRATTLRRVASGVRAQALGELGLNAQERKVLTDAAALLERMAQACKSAAAIRKKRAADTARREKAIQAAMRANFCALTSIADQIALIGAAQAYALESGAIRFNSPQALLAAFNDAIDGLAHSLARADDARNAQAIVTEAWTKFEKIKPSIQAKHRALIDALTLKESPALLAKKSAGAATR